MPRSDEKSHRRRHRIGDADNWQCYLCGRKLTCVRCHPETTKGFVATLDHVVPRALGGRATLDNLRLACQTCNCKKADSLLPLTYLIAEVPKAA